MATASGSSVDEVAAALYRLPPDAFTAARDEQAARADAADAAQIKALRKPVVSAWAVNLLVADGQLAEAVDLAAALREAQDDLDAVELRRLGSQRQQLVASLAKRAAVLAEEAGHPLAASAREAVAQTVNAAVMDERAAAVVLTGRLRKPLDAGALDDLDTADLIAGSPPCGLPASAERAASADPDELAERRARKAAERAARDAERTAGAAERERAAAEAAERKAREQVDQLHARIAEARVQLERLLADAEAADAELAQRVAQRRHAADAAKAAAKQAERARDAVPD